MDDGLVFFSSCNIRAFYTRENKPRLTLATVYKIRNRNYLYEYIFPGQYKPRLEKDVNVDFVPFRRGEHWGNCEEELPKKPVGRLSLGQQKSVFLNLKPYKTSLKLLRKKSHNLHYLSHNWPF